MAKKKKFVKIILFTIVLIPLIFFILNYFLARRLEIYLKKELVSRVSEATDHFYMLSFEDLSISLLNGELKIEGIEFKPDSAVFQQWQLQDSLPDVYFKAKIDIIDFEGINLIWRWSYKQLNFKTFEIHSPILEINSTYNSSQPEQQEDTAKVEVKSLHELIEPYINVLTVGTLNLEHAFVSYNVENPLTPIIYKLEDVSFHAYGFRLDSLSYNSGKLLYSDNFDFVTNRNQTLLTNNEFSLLTDSIRLSTNDSIIYLQNIHLVPQEKLWSKTNKIPSDYVDGQIERVQVDGIFFTRKNALNYLEATTFGIYHPDIKVYSLAPRQKEKKDNTKKPAISPDSLMQSLSLYDLISPILHSVSIDQVSLENTKADYYYAFHDSIEIYHLAEFNFHAYNFLVDSLADAENTFWYSKNFAFEAKGFEGILKARNHKISVGRVNLDTEKRHFHIENVHLQPISTQTPNDYMEGNIRSVRIDGLAYNSGISAELFHIESPDIRYVQGVIPKKKDTIQSVDKNRNLADIQLMLNPFLDYLSIRNIRINKANTSFLDRNEDDTITYKINDFNFYAIDFLINNRTINRENKLFFDYKNFGFNFRKFDNYILNNEYRLTIDSAAFSTSEGLRLENIAFIPQKELDMSVSLKAPLIELASPSWALSLNHLLFKMQSINLDRFSMMNAEVGFNYKNMHLDQIIDVELKGLQYDNEKQDYDIKDIYFHTKNVDFDLGGGFYKLHAGDILLDSNTLNLNDVRLESPYSKEEFAYKHPKHSDWLGLSIKNFSLNNIDLSSLMKKQILLAESAVADSVIFGTYKNKKIPVPLTFKPMIYELLQKAPYKIDISSVTVNHMDLMYEELSMKGKQPGKLFFTDMNGVFHGFTNIVKHPEQYIKLEANAKFMDNGYFTANWQIPVDSLNKRFLLDAHMPALDFATLNAMVTPMAPISIESGKVDDLTFSINGTDRMADIHMQLLYSDLKVDFLKEKDEEMVKSKVPSTLINSIVRNNNPRHKNSKPHISDITAVERDVNRSTFNYIWFILRPAMADAVGISETTQHVATEAAGFIKTIKSLFHHKHTDDAEKTDDSDE